MSVGAHMDVLFLGSTWLAWLVGWLTGWLAGLVGWWVVWLVAWHIFTFCFLSSVFCLEFLVFVFAGSSVDPSCFGMMS